MWRLSVKEKPPRCLKVEGDYISLFKKLLLKPLMCLMRQTWAVKHYIILGRCCGRLKEPPLMLWCSAFGWDADEGRLTHKQVHPPKQRFQNTHTPHTHIFGIFVLQSQSFFFLLVPNTHKRAHTRTFLPAETSNVFLPPSTTPTPPKNKNHSLFLLYLLLTSKAHFSQQLPSVRY